jgi:hypothetical protein
VRDEEGREREGERERLTKLSDVLMTTKGRYATQGRFFKGLHHSGIRAPGPDHSLKMVKASVSIPYRVLCGVRTPKLAGCRD